MKCLLLWKLGCVFLKEFVWMFFSAIERSRQNYRSRIKWHLSEVKRKSKGKDGTVSALLSFKIQRARGLCTNIPCSCGSTEYHRGQVLGWLRLGAQPGHWALERQMRESDPVSVAERKWRAGPHPRVHDHLSSKTCDIAETTAHTVLSINNTSDPFKLSR